MKRRIVLSILIGLGGSIATAQTRPAPATLPLPTTRPTVNKVQWQDVVEHFAQVIADHDASLLREALADHPTVRSFDGQTDETAKLPNAVAGAVVLGIHAYSNLPDTLAADIAGDFSDAASVPEDVKRKMVPDESLMTRANDTAHRWLASKLGSTTGSVAVIVLWREHSNLDQISALFKDGPGEVIFVLLRGQEINGAPHIRHVIFGDPLASAN